MPEGVSVATTYTREEVAKHDTLDDLWIVVNDEVLDISDFGRSHPGGAAPLLAMAGSDATDAVIAMHPEYVMKLVNGYSIGKLASPSRPSESLLAYRELRQALKEEGLFVTDSWWYIREAVRLACIFAAMVYVTLFTGNGWIRAVCGGLLLGVFFQQLAFVGHDLGHNGVTHRSTKKTFWNDMTLGVLVGNALSGIGMGWWKSTHNVHHIVTNSIERDPDIQHLPFFAISPKYTNSIFSIYHQRVLQFDWAAKIFVSMQHYLYWVVMCFARANLYVQTFKFLLVHQDARRTRWSELAALGVFWAWFCSLIYFAFDSAWQAAIFVIVSHSFAGILHVQITLSHFSMDTIDGVPTAFVENSDETPNFLTKQLATTLDVDCPTWMDWFHGGLQFQTVHHLFPRLPRHNLRAVSERLQTLCDEQGLHYHRISFLEANIEVFQALKKAATETHELSPLFTSMVNAEG